MIPIETHLKIGGLIFPEIDQMDFTGPFEVLSCIPNSKFYTIWKNKMPVRDMGGMLLLADTTFEEAPQLDVLLVPGGYGQEMLMTDAIFLEFIRHQARSAQYIYSVCTGALLCGAAGLLHGRRATTHWTAIDILSYYGAIPVHERVVVDGNFISAGGVTAGIDGALIVSAILRGQTLAQEIQLKMAYDPQPPFKAGSPYTAPLHVLQMVNQHATDITQRRLKTAYRYQKSLLDCMGKS